MPTFQEWWDANWENVAGWDGTGQCHAGWNAGFHAALEWAAKVCDDFAFRGPAGLPGPELLCTQAAAAIRRGPGGGG